jgi:hypothetical protein
MATASHPVTGLTGAHRKVEAPENVPSLSEETEVALDQVTGDQVRPLVPRAPKRGAKAVYEAVEKATSTAELAPVPARSRLLLKGPEYQC